MAEIKPRENRDRNKLSPSFYFLRYFAFVVFGYEYIGRIDSFI